MVDDTLKSVGLTGVRLAKLTGQDQNTVSRKLNGRQGLVLGAREAGVMACFAVMDEEQRSAVDDAFARILAGFSKKE